jgi:broad specificity phosphatase PhoE
MPRRETGDPTQLLAVVRGASDRPGAPPILLLRHAARDSLVEASVSAAVNAALTPEGREQAAALGARLPGAGGDIGRSAPARGGASPLPPARAVRLYHSPVERCAETARLLARGIRDSGGQARVVGERACLGAAFLRDPRLAIDQFAKLGMGGFVRAWVKGEVPEPIAAPYRETAAALLAALVTERDAAPGALHLHVGHDLTVITLVGLGFDVGMRGFPWPGFLDGCALVEEEAGLMCHYMGMAHPIRL